METLSGIAILGLSMIAFFAIVWAMAQTIRAMDLEDELKALKKEMRELDEANESLTLDTDMLKKIFWGE